MADETGIYRFIKAVTLAEKILLQALTQNPNVMGVFSDNGETVPHVVLASRQIGKLIPVGQQGHVSIVSVNGTQMRLIASGREPKTPLSETNNE